MKNRFWTFRYAIINASFFAGFCCIHAYASPYLLAKGFSNSMIGIILAMASIVSVLVQPVVAGFIDAPGKATNRNSTCVCLILMAVMAACMPFVSNALVIGVLYVLMYMIQMLVQPLIIAMNFEYAAEGANINFGLARGLGSCGFAALSPFLGSWITSFGEDVMPWVFIVSLAICFLFVFTFIIDKSDKKTGVIKSDAIRTDDDINHDDNTDGSITAIETGKDDERDIIAGKDIIEATSTIEGADIIEGEAHNNFFDFARHYPKFMLYILAVVLFFFSHNALNDYLIQIIRPIGGNEATMGYMVSMAAFLELPTMAGFIYFARKIDCGNLIKISGLMFAVKTAIMLLAVAIPMAFVSQLCQMGAYALFTPANAYYCSKVMEKNDQVKGQAYSNAALTLGGVFSGFVCGPLLDASGPKMMLFVATILTGIGAVIAIFSVEKVGKAD